MVTMSKWVWRLGGTVLLLVSACSPQPEVEVGKTAQAQEAIEGRWDGPFCFPVNAVNTINTHTGKILIWPGHGGFNGIPAWLWDPQDAWDPTNPSDICFGDQPQSGEQPGCFDFVQNNETNLFCSGHAQLADGRIMITGGHNPVQPNSAGLLDANIWNPESETWTPRAEVGQMNHHRWYPTLTTLPDGRIIAMSGSNRTCTTDPTLTCGTNAECPGGGTCTVINIADIPEVYSTATNTWVEFPTNPGSAADMPFYPLMYILPNGTLFYAGTEDGSGLGAATAPTENRMLNLATGDWTPAAPILSSVPGASGVMYEPGKIMKAGGGFFPSTAGAQIIDLTSGSGSWVDIPDMPGGGRVRSNMTMLPDGTALVTGGTRWGNLEYASFCNASSPNPGGECRPPSLPPDLPRSDCPNTSGAVLCSPTECTDIFPEMVAAGFSFEQQLWVAQADLFVPDPGAEHWVPMASMQTPRMYHSTAILLPDGRVFSGGGGLGGGAINNYSTYEMFSPPYLFTGTPRPIATLVPKAIAYGVPFDVETPNGPDIAKVSLIRLGATTHGNDQDERFIPLDFSTITGGLEIDAALVGGAAMPLDANIAPPGYYMLFLVDTLGVPSIGEYVRVGEGPLAICQDVSTTTDPGVCTAAVSVDDGSFDPGGSAVTLSQDPPGPYGLTPTLVTLTVTDGDGLTDTCQATVTVEDDEAPVLEPVDDIVQIRCDFDATGVTIDPPAVMDNCSDPGAVMVTGVIVSSSNPAVSVPLPISGPSTSLPAGVYVIEWTATDEAGNTSDVLVQNVTVRPGVHASDSIVIRENVSEVLLAGGGHASIANSGSALTDIRNDALVGDIHSVAEVAIGHRATVEDVLSETAITWDDGVAFADQPSIASETIAPVSLPAPMDLSSVTFPTTPGEVFVNGAVGPLPPGEYGSYTLNSGGVLTLEGGVYFFEALTLNAASSTVVVAADTVLFVKNSTQIQGGFIDGGGAIANVFLGFAGENLNLANDFVGTIVAPNATVRLGTANAQVFRGVIHAQTIDLQNGSDFICEAIPCTSSVCGDASDTPPDTCLDGIQNGDEEGVDCGGSCPDTCPGACNSASYEAEGMFHSTGGAFTDGWNLWANGFISTNHDFTAGPSVVRVRAQGQAAQGVAPHMIVSVGGSVIGDVSVAATDWTDYEFFFDASGGTQEIRITFDNDFFAPPEDRNLILDSVAVDCDEPPMDGELSATILGPTADWGSGYCVSILASNAGPGPVSNWSVTVNLNATTTFTEWNGLFSDDSGVVTIMPAFSWNQMIPPGGSDDTIGFCANRNNPSSGNLPFVVSTSP